MAAGSLSHGVFTFETTKRKRIYDDDDLMNDVYSSLKRRNTAQLPIRSPPRHISTISATGLFDVGPGTLTPDSIPESDEGHQHQPVLNEPRTPVSSQSASVYRSNIDDTEMDMSPPKLQNVLTPIRIGRARSNDLMSPVRSPGLVPPSPAQKFARDRVPTPVASSFPAKSPFETSFAAAANRHMRSHPLTTLSPMVDAESWTPRIRRPPSPGPDDDLDPDDMMMEDDSVMSAEDDQVINSSFSSLSVRNQGSTQPTWTDSSIRSGALGLDGDRAAGRPDGLRMSMIDEGIPTMSAPNRMQSSGRTGRLHMGYRSDCDKCVARVPGHYSHILWT